MLQLNLVVYTLYEYTYDTCDVRSVLPANWLSAA